MQTNQPNQFLPFGRLAQLEWDGGKELIKSAKSITHRPAGLSASKKLKGKRKKFL